MLVNREKLLVALNKIKPGLANKDIISQSTSFVFKDGFIITFNDEVCVATPFDIGFEGAIRASEFFKLLGKLKSDEIEIEPTETELIIHNKKSKAVLKVDTLITLPIDEVVPSGKFHDVPDNFSEVVFRASLCASKDMSNPIRTSVQISGKHAVATDNYRIMKTELDSNIDDEILIPATAARFLPEYKFLKYNLTDGWLHLEEEDQTVFSIRLMSGDYPEVDEFFEVKGEEIQFPNGIIEILERTGIFTAGSEGGDYVDVKVSDKKMIITGKGDNGWYEESANCRYNGEEIKFSVDPGLLIDILKDLKKCTVSDTLLLFEGDNFTHLVALVA